MFALGTPRPLVPRLLSTALVTPVMRVNQPWPEIGSVSSKT